MIARLQKQAAEQQTAHANEGLRENEDDFRHGNRLRVATLDEGVGVLEAQQSVLKLDLQIADLTTGRNDLMALSSGYSSRT